MRRRRGSWKDLGKLGTKVRTRFEQFGIWREGAAFVTRVCGTVNKDTVSDRVPRSPTLRVVAA